MILLLFVLGCADPADTGPVGTLTDGELCGGDLGLCASGLACCQPCGDGSCANTCEPACDEADDPACAGGCFAYPSDGR